jgi:hypothetical protein
MANPNNKGPGKSQQTTRNRNTAQKRPETSKPLNIELVLFFSSASQCFPPFFFLVARPAAKDRPASTPAPSSRKKTGGSSRQPATRVHAAPINMDDGSDVDGPATASQDCSPPMVNHTRRQSQVPKTSVSSYRRVHAGRRVPDDEEEEVIEEDKTDQENEDEDDIYGGVDGAVGNALGNEVGRLPTFIYLRYMLADNPNSHS